MPEHPSAGPSPRGLSGHRRDRYVAFTPYRVRERPLGKSGLPRRRSPSTHPLKSSVKLRSVWKRQSSFTRLRESGVDGLPVARSKKQRTWPQAPAPRRFAFSRPVSESRIGENAFGNGYRETELGGIVGFFSVAIGTPTSSTSASWSLASASVSGTAGTGRRTRARAARCGSAAGRARSGDDRGR